MQEANMLSCDKKTNKTGNENHREGVWNFRTMLFLIYIAYIIIIQIIIIIIIRRR